MMKTARLRALAVAALAITATAGCTDTLVEPKSTVSSANVFSDPTSYRSFLAKIYGGLVVTGQQGPAGRGDIEGIDEGFSHYMRQYWQMQELPTDEAVIGWGDAGLPELNTHLWSSSNQFFAAMYARVYFQVAMANELLRETTEAKLSARGHANLAEIPQYRAEARALRALSYWHGIDLFGDISLVTEDFALGAVPPEQSTRTAIFDFIVAELEDLRDDLPAAGAGQYGRLDQGGVDMLLAKLYLNAGVYTGTDRYAEALAAAQRVIDSGAYELDDDYQDMFLADNHTSPEIIFAIPQDGVHTQTWGGMTFLAHAAVGGNMDAAAYGLDGGWWGLRVTPEFVGLFGGDIGDDERAIFYTNGQTLEVTSLSNFNSGYAYPKYRNVTQAGEPGSNSTFPDIDFPVFRLADAYLMYAEAHLRGGGGSLATALQYVNDLRERAFGDTSGNLAALTLDVILAERARELAWEAHRRQDLVRFGLFTGGSYVWAFKGGTPAGQATDDFRVLYPIPATELLANPNLEQNPGY